MGRPASHAFVFYGRVQDFGKQIGHPVDLVLAAALAHEVGHLLIGLGHAPMEIMRARWDRQSMTGAAWSRLGFDSEQAERLQTEVRVRAELSEPAARAAR